MIFQGAMNAMNPVKKIGWQIAEPMAFHGAAQGAAARRRARELLELAGIPASAAERYPHELSGGMRQRVHRHGPRLPAEDAAHRRADRCATRPRSWRSSWPRWPESVTEP